jgi:hypothetical protein
MEHVASVRWGNSGLNLLKECIEFFFLIMKTHKEQDASM